MFAGSLQIRTRATCHLTRLLLATTSRNSAREVKRLLSAFRFEDDEIEDKVMLDGFPQMPDEPETGSGSGQSNDSAGRLPSSGNKRRTNS